MRTRYIIYLCVTYMQTCCNTQDVLNETALDEKEIEMLWDAIRGNDEFINYDDLRVYYKDDTPVKDDELKKLIEDFGQPNQLIMGFTEFKNAANGGRIDICSVTAMENAFNEMIQDKNRQYVTKEELFKNYESMIIKPQLENVMNTYGTLLRTFLSSLLGFQEVQKLEFEGFRQAVNRGHLPRPLRDQIAYNAEIVQILNRMNGEKGLDHVSDVGLCCYYTDKQYKQFSEMREKYYFYPETTNGRPQRIIKIEDFINAANECIIPRFDISLMKRQFKEMIPNDEDTEFVTFEKLKEHYNTLVPTTTLEYIKTHFWIDFGFFGIITFDNFSRAMNCGHLPGLFHDKLTMMYTLFKEIIPVNTRNYILLDDMEKHYPNKSSEDLDRVIIKHGELHDDSKEWRLYFQDFKRAIYLLDIPFP